MIAEPDYYVSAQVAVPPSDPYYDQQWALPVIGAPEAWLELPADAPQVVVAVIDSGICADHPDLAGRVLPGWDFVEDDAQPQDAFGHGCGVAGIIAANIDDGIGMAGVAPNALILPLRVLDGSGHRDILGRGGSDGLRSGQRRTGDQPVAGWRRIRRVCWSRRSITPSAKA